jgi:hypothetical protein
MSYDVRGFFIDQGLLDIRDGVKGATEDLARQLADALRTRPQDLHAKEMDALVRLLEGVATKKKASQAWGGRAGRPRSTDRHFQIYEDVENCLIEGGKFDATAVQFAAEQVGQARGMCDERVWRIYYEYSRARDPDI